MGNTWTVEVFGNWTPGQLSFEQVYSGESFIGALLAMWKYRKQGTGYLKLDWRPERP